MKTVYKDTEIGFDVERVDDKLLYYGCAWVSVGGLICESGDTLESMCENLILSVTAYNNDDYQF